MTRTATAARRLALGIALATGLTSCADDPLGPNRSDPLTEEEIGRVISTITDAYSVANASPATAAPAHTPLSVERTFDASFPCETAGVIAVSGSMTRTEDDEGAAGTHDALRVRLVPEGCTVPIAAGSLTLDGDPLVQMEVDVTWANGLIALNGSETGWISYTLSDGRSGSCRFDHHFSLLVDFSEETAERSESGTICGVSVSDLEFP